MGCNIFLVLLVASSTLLNLTAARAVNISNTWMLPEEGFPVFYRYFRDRISWYEADAVCQFHHANLVTADTSSQYDAIRAYLKELDITENVWIGLSKGADKPHFTWTDFRLLNSDAGHWQETIPASNDALCVSMDPASDFLWKARPCGGPEIAAFICELPIPSWALGTRGCLLTEIPSLTVLYIPEQSALELTSDCGLDGTKRVACKGNADREDLLKELSCSITHEDLFESDSKTTKSSISMQTSTTPGFDDDTNSVNGRTTKPWIFTSNTIDIEYGMPTSRHRRETEDTLSPLSSTVSSSIAYSSNSDTTLDSSVSKLEATEMVVETTTESGRTETETFVTSATVTTDAKLQEANVDEANGEFSSAISQGQLFSIIENGTMFDIIELNETSTDDSKPRDIASIERHSKTTRRPEIPTTTAAYNKEALSAIQTVVTNKSIKITKKEMYKNFDAKKANHLSKIAAAKLSKETELYPIVSDNSLILNRTHRKALPLTETSKHVEIQIKNADSFIVTTNINSNKESLDVESSSAPVPDNIETLRQDESAGHAIDPKLHVLNSNQGGADKNNETEILPTTTISTSTQTAQFVEEPAKPNRQRQLTRPQRRSFYPYFFSRVLG